MGDRNSSKSGSQRRYPPADDELNLFNVPDRRGGELWAVFHPEDMGHDPYLYITTAPRLEEITETSEVVSLASASISKYLDSVNYPVVTELGDVIFDKDMFRYRGEVGGLFAPIDRTMQTPLMDPTMYTGGLIRHIQSTALKEHPEWRLHVVGTTLDGEKSLMIYADAVCVGQRCCPPHQLELELETWREKILAIREAKKGPGLRQALVAKRRVPEHIARMAESPVVLVAAFDHYYGNRGEHTIWVLRRRGRVSYDVAVPENRGAGWQYPIAADGNIPMIEAPLRNFDWSKAVYHLSAYTVPAGSTNTLVFRLQTFDNLGKRVWLEAREIEVVVQPSEMLTDEQARVILQQ